MSEPSNLEMALSAQKLDAIIGDVGEIKQSLKELTQAVNRLALVEERLANTTDALDRAFKEIEKQDHRIKTLEQAQPIQKQSSDIVQKAIGMIIVVVFSAMIGAVLINPRPQTPTVVQGR